MNLQEATKVYILYYKLKSNWFRHSPHLGTDITTAKQKAEDLLAKTQMQWEEAIINDRLTAHCIIPDGEWVDYSNGIFSMHSGQKTSSHKKLI